LGDVSVGVIAFHLPFSDHVHDLDSRQDDAGTPEVLETHHRPDDPFDCTVVLLHDIVQVFVLSDLNGCFPFRGQRLKSGPVRAALCIIAIAATDTPGPWQAATTSALNSSVYRRRLRRPRGHPGQ
jgi:hypothetical protein